MEAGGRAEPKPKPPRPPAPEPTKEQAKDEGGETEHRPYALPDWLRVFDDEGDRRTRTASARG